MPTTPMLPTPTSSSPTIRASARSRRAVVAGAVALLLLMAACSGGESGSSKLPDANLVSLDSGAPTTWGGEGRPLVVNLWASWCSPCRAEMPAFQKVAERLGGKVDFIGVTDDPDLDAARKVAKATGVEYPLAVDVDQNVLIDLDVVGLPATVFVDEEGQIIGRHAGALTESELLTEIEKRYDIRP